ncbi:MAG: DUF1830 domain-containing protein [Cyanobacteria bacterium P01_A01_bin.83]
MSISATAQSPTEVLYHYLNSTHNVQIVCLVNSEGVSMEKAVLPKQKILFTDIPEGRLEIYASKKGKKALQKVIYYQDFAVENLES